MKNEKNKSLFKEFLISWLELQIERLEYNSCSEDDINKISQMVNNDLDTKITRKDAMRFFEVEQNVFDTTIHRRLHSKFVVRNVVMYPFSKIYDLFKK